MPSAIDDPKVVAEDPSAWGAVILSPAEDDSPEAWGAVVLSAGDVAPAARLKPVASPVESLAPDEGQNPGDQLEIPPDYSGQLTSEAEAPKSNTIANLGREVLGGVASGVADIVGGLSGAVAQSTASRDLKNSTRVLAELEAIPEASRSRAESAEITRIKGGVEGLRKLEALDVAAAKPYREFQETAAEASKEAQTFFGQDPKRQDEFLSKLAKGAGSLPPYIVSAMTGGPALSMIVGSLQTGQSEYNAAIEAGRPDLANEAMEKGMTIGMTEAVGVGGGVSEAARGFARKALKTLLASAKEGGQEWVQKTLSNLNANTATGYEPERPTFEGGAEAFAIGSILGGAVEGASQAARRDKSASAEPVSSTAPNGPLSPADMLSRAQQQRAWLDTQPDSAEVTEERDLIDLHINAADGPQQLGQLYGFDVRETPEQARSRMAEQAAASRLRATQESVAAMLKAAAAAREVGMTASADAAEANAAAILRAVEGPVTDAQYGRTMDAYDAFAGTQQKPLAQPEPTTPPTTASPAIAPDAVSPEPTATPAAPASDTNAETPTATPPTKVEAPPSRVAPEGQDAAAPIAPADVAGSGITPSGDAVTQEAAPVAPTPDGAPVAAESADAFDKALQDERRAYRKDVESRPIEQQPPRMWYELEAARTKGIGPNELTGDEIRAYKQQWQNAVDAAISEGKPVYAGGKYFEEPPKSGWTKSGELWVPPPVKAPTVRVAGPRPASKATPTAPPTQSAPQTPVAPTSDLPVASDEQTPTPATPQAVTPAADGGGTSAASGAVKAKRTKPRKPFPPSASGHDAIDQLLGFIGKIKHPETARWEKLHQGRKGIAKTTERGGEYDGWMNLPPELRRHIFEPVARARGEGRGVSPDTAAQGAYDGIPDEGVAGFIRSASPDALLDALRDAYKSRVQLEKSAKAQQAEATANAEQSEAQLVAWEKESVVQQPGSVALTTWDLSDGDVIEVNGEVMTVAENPDGSLILDDGSRYGAQSLEEGAVIYGELTEPMLDVVADAPTLDSPQKADAYILANAGAKPGAAELPSPSAAPVERDESADPQGQGDVEAVTGGEVTPKLPQLRAGKSSDDLLQGDNDVFNLVSETAADKAARLKSEAAEEAAKRAKDAAEAKALQDKQQLDIFATNQSANTSPSTQRTTEAVPARANTTPTKRLGIEPEDQGREAARMEAAIGSPGGRDVVLRSPENPYLPSSTNWREWKRGYEAESKAILEKKRTPQVAPKAAALKPLETQVRPALTKLELKEKGWDVSTKYQEDVSRNLEHMDTPMSEWSAVPIKGFSDTVNGKGEPVKMPEFDFPKGYSSAPTLYKGDAMGGACGLCGHDIVNHFWIQNNAKKWTMPVGSECITRFTEGEKSGQRMAKEVEWEQNRSFLREARRVQDEVHKVFTFRQHQGYGRYGTGWDNGPIRKAHDELKKLIGEHRADDKDAWTKADADGVVSAWVGRRGEKVRAKLAEIDEILATPYSQKKLTDFYAKEKADAEKILAEQKLSDGTPINDQITKWQTQRLETAKKRLSELTPKPAEPAESESSKPAPAGREKLHTDAYSIADGIADGVAKGQPDSVREAAFDAAYRNAAASIESGGQFNPDFMRKSAMTAASKEAAKLGTTLNEPIGDSETTGQDLLPSKEAGPSEQAQAGDLQTLIESEMAKLPDTERRIIEETAAGTPDDVIAEALGITEGSVRSMRSKARKTLQEGISKRAQESISDEPPRTSIAPDALRDVVSQLQAKFKGATNTVIVADGSALPAPVLDKARSLGIDPNRIGGVYHDGTVWLNAAGIASPERAVSIFFHEQAGHHGVSRILEGIKPGSEKRLADTLKREFPAEWQYVSERYEPKSQVDETLARIMERFGPSQTRPTAWRRVVDLIRSILAKAGVKNWSRGDVEALLRRGVERIRTQRADGTDGTKFSTEEQTKEERRARFREDSERRRAARAEFVSESVRAAGESGGLVYRSSVAGREDAQLLVTPNIGDKGEWRVTQIDKHGPYGHFVFENREAAIRAVAGESHTKLVPGPPYFGLGPYTLESATSASKIAKDVRFSIEGERPKPPIKLPSKRAETPEAEPTGMRNAIVDEERAARGIPERETPMRRTFGSVWDEAQRIAAANPNRARALVAELKEKTRPLTDLEDALLTHEQMVRQDAFDRAMSRMNAATDPSERAQAEAELSVARNDVAEIYDVGQRAGTENARGLNARKLLINQDYTLARMEARMRSAGKGEALSPKELATIERQAKEIEALKKQVEDAEKAASDADALAILKRVQDGIKKTRTAKASGKSLADHLQERRVDALQRLTQLRDKAIKFAVEGEASKPARLPAAELSLIAEYGSSVIQDGARSKADFTQQMEEVFGAQIRPHMDEIFAAAKEQNAIDRATYNAGRTPKGERTPAEIVGGVKKEAEGETPEGITQSMVYDLVRAHVAEDPSMTLDKSKVSEIMGKVADELQELQPGITPDEVRDMFSGHGKVTFPSKEQLNVKMRELRSASDIIAKIEEASRGEPVKRTGMQRDKPGPIIRELGKELIRTMRANGIETRTAESMLRTAHDARMTRLRNAIEDVERQMQTGQRTPAAPETPWTPEETALKAQLEEMKTRLDALLNEPDSDQISNILGRIEDVTERLRTGNIKPKAKSQNVPTQKLAEAQAQLASLNKELAERRKAQRLTENPPKTDEERQIESLEKQEETLTEMIRTGSIDAATGKATADTQEVAAARERVAALRKQLAELRKEKRQRENPPKTPEQRYLESLERRNKAARDMLASGALFRAPGKGTPTSPAIEAARAELHETNRLLAEARKTSAEGVQRMIDSLRAAIEKRTAEYEEKIAAGDFTRKPKPTKRPEDADVSKARYKLSQVKQEFERGVFEKEQEGRTKLQKVMDTAIKVSNLRRALMTGGELSGSLRQGALITYGAPIQAVKSFTSAFESLLSKEGEFKVNEAIRNDPDAALADRAKLFLSDERALDTKMIEEHAASKWAESIPWISHTQRFYTSFLNQLRMDIFKTEIAAIRKSGRKVTEEDARAVANMINIFTGRGNIGKNNAGAGDVVNAVAFAARFVASRFQAALLRPLMGPQARAASWYVKGRIAQRYARAALGYVAAQYIMALLSDYEDRQKDESFWDWTSSKFQKVKVNNTFVDLTAGLGSAIVLMGRLAQGEYTTGSGRKIPLRGEGSGDYGDPDTWKVITDFAKGKMAPNVQTALEFATGRDFNGKPVPASMDGINPDVDAKDAAKWALKQTSPITYWDIGKVLEDSGWPRGAALAVAAFFGVSMSTREEKEQKSKPVSDRAPTRRGAVTY